MVDFVKPIIESKSKFIVGDTHYVTAAGFRSRYLWFFDRLNKHLKSKGEKPIDKKTPHSTRHTCATLWQMNSMPLAMVSQLLGHHSTSVTDKYTHLNDTAVLSEAVKKYGLTL